MTTKITRFDEELVEKSARFLAAAAAHPASRKHLENYGFDAEEQARGKKLVEDSRLAFIAEWNDTAWNFLSPTPVRRRAEARHWYADRRRRWMRENFRKAEEDAGFVGDGPASKLPLPRKLLGGLFVGARYATRALSPITWWQHRSRLSKDLEQASAERPANSPPPKDTVLVELNGWYERWRLLAQRVFRERPDLMEPFGLVPGKAPPRLRNKVARVKYGEKAAGSIPGANVELDDDVDQASGADERVPEGGARLGEEAGQQRKRSLPVIEQRRG